MLQKKNIGLLILLFFCTFSVNSLFAQGKKQYFNAYKAIGDTCYKEYNYFGAHQAYEKALSYNSDDVEVNFICAEACRLYQNYQYAEFYYQKTKSLDSLSYPLAQFWYADVLKIQGKYEEAATEFDKYAYTHRNKADYYTLKARHEAEVCYKKVKSVPKNQLVIKRLDNQEINSMYAQYAPVQYNDSLFFFGAIVPIDKQMADTQYVFKNYITKLAYGFIKDSVWTYGGILDSINDTILHVNNITFSKDGKIAYFSKCKDYDCAIYRADFDPKKIVFSNVEKLNSRINKPGTSNTTPHIAITPETELLFWSSNRKDGQGGYDIWYAKMHKVNGSFENPRNCGTNVNTKGDDITPFYDARDSLLFFSSNWHTSLGGYDVFKAKNDIRKNKWEEAKNAGTEINTSYNDLYYTYSRDSLRAYWVSNRTESQKLLNKAHSNDIYSHPLNRKSVIRISDLIPISLFFDNDHPDPRSRDTLTNKVYGDLYQNYIFRKQEYIDGYTLNASPGNYDLNYKSVDVFFKYVDKQYKNLETFTRISHVLLQDGVDLVIVLKGYASPLAKTSYNEIVAKKRVHCVLNYFYEYKDGALLQYMENEPRSGKGSLKFVQEPIGELQLESVLPGNTPELNKNAISDRNQYWMSVYSPFAAYQRKVEIVAVGIDSKEALFEEIKHEIKNSKKIIEDDGSLVKSLKSTPKPSASQKQSSQKTTAKAAINTIKVSEKVSNLISEENQKMIDSTNTEIDVTESMNATISNTTAIPTIEATPVENDNEDEDVIEVRPIDAPISTSETTTKVVSEETVAPASTQNSTTPAIQEATPIVPERQAVEDEEESTTPATTVSSENKAVSEEEEETSVPVQNTTTPATQEASPAAPVTPLNEDDEEEATPEITTPTTQEIAPATSITPVNPVSTETKVVIEEEDEEETTPSTPTVTENSTTENTTKTVSIEEELDAILATPVEAPVSASVTTSVTTTEDDEEETTVTTTQTTANSTVSVTTVTKESANIEDEEDKEETIIETKPTSAPANKPIEAKATTQQKSTTESPKPTTKPAQQKAVVKTETAKPTTKKVEPNQPKATTTATVEQKSAQVEELEKEISKLRDVSELMLEELKAMRAELAKFKADQEAEQKKVDDTKIKKPKNNDIIVD